MDNFNVQDNKVLVIRLEGRIDSNNAEALGREIASQREEAHGALVFDARKLAYISSAGLRVLMQVMKAEKKAGNEPVSLVEVSREVYDVLQMTGFTEMVKVQKAYREISLEGSQLIGEGFFGKVYRLDADTIVKLYAGEDSIPMIKREQSRARQAFIKGIPTAISYDIVRVGSQYGAVFELLQARSFNDLVIEYEDEPEKLEALMERYVDCLKQVHATEMEAGELPLARDEMLDRLSCLRECLPEEILLGLQKLLRDLPEDFHVVHGDFQMKNVMLCKDEPMLIDMETLCTGQPVFDLQGLYVTYKAFPEDEPDNVRAFLGIRPETADYIWRRLLELYFGTEDKAVLMGLEDKIRVAAAIRFLHLLVATPLKDTALADLRIQHTREHLQELLPRVTSLSFD